MKPSMRTRVSFEVACGRLGLQPIVLGPGDAFSRGETIEDTTRVLERYVDVIVIRTFEQAQVEQIAEVASIPVVNALTDDYHPCQVLADLLTIEEHLGRLAGREARVRRRRQQHREHAAARLPARRHEPRPSRRPRATSRCPRPSRTAQRIAERDAAPRSASHARPGRGRRAAPTSS